MLQSQKATQTSRLVTVVYSHRLRFELAWWCFFICNLSMRSDTNADIVTAPAITPSMMPARAPLLIPDDEGGGMTAKEQ